ncbi:MAG: lipocalin family protein, partial [Bacteroidota bacterium]
NARVLIAGDSVKTWKLARRFNNGTRMNMGDCFLSYRQSFVKNGTFSSGSSDTKNCGEIMNGKWVLAKDVESNSYIKLESDQIPEMLNIVDDFKLFKIKNLSDSLLVLQFNHAQTTKKQTVMIDYFVPEGMEVDDRHFHW